MDKRITTSIIAAAQRSQRDSYVPASVSIAQWAIESAWGTKLSGRNNPFGIKAIPGHTYTSRWTREVLGGVSKQMQQNFADFESLDEAFVEHGKLFHRVSLYHPAIDAWLGGDLQMGVVLMGRHYATDPHYASTIMSVINSNGLAQFDKLPGDVVTQPKSESSPASVSKPEAIDWDAIMQGLLGSVASFVFGLASKGNMVTEVAQAATGIPDFAKGVFRSLDDAKKGFAELEELFNDIKSGKYNEVPEDVVAIFQTARDIMKKFGIDHDALNAATVKVAQLDSVDTLKAKG